MNWVLMMGQVPAEGQGGGSQMLPMIMMWMVIIAIFYFLMIRPQKKKQDALKQMMENIKRGDRVLTSGGLFGTVVGTKEGIALLPLLVAGVIDVVEIQGAFVPPGDARAFGVGVETELGDADAGDLHESGAAQAEIENGM